MTLVLSATALSADTAQVGYYRFPTLSDDSIVFAAEGDLWEVPATGGRATRITTHEGNEAFPKFSPDGRWLAFSTEYQGNEAVYVMPAQGGEPRRLTWYPGRDEVMAWRPDSSAIVFRSERETVHWEDHLYEVPVGGGPIKRVEVGMGSLASFSKDGKLIAFNRWSTEFRTWKRYRGGTAPDIWVGNLLDGTFKKITDWEGTDDFPMWNGQRVCFLSDRDGRENVYSCRPDGSDVHQHTRHADYDVRWPDIHDGRVVYMLGGDLWLLDIAAGTDRKLDITLPSDRIRHQPRFEDASKTLESYRLNPNGSKLAVCSRGQVWTCPPKEGLVTQLTHSSGIRVRCPVYSHDGRRIACITDETGEQEVAILDAAGKAERRIVTHQNRGWLFSPTWSPDGKRIAWADLTMALFLLDLDSGQVTTVDKGQVSEISDYAFSPDARWLAYVRQGDNYNNELRVYRIADGKSFPVSTEFSNDSNPVWDPNGKYLYFLSSRTFNPSLDERELNFICTRTVMPYAAILAADGLSPFLPEEMLGEPPGEKKDKDTGDKPVMTQPALAEMKVDPEGLPRRVVAFPVDAGNYSNLSATRDKIFYLSCDTPGLMDVKIFETDERPRFTLQAYDFKTRKARAFVPKLRDYAISENGNKIAYRVKDEILFAKTDGKFTDEGDKGDAKEDKDQADDPQKEKVKPSELRLAVKPDQEWRQIFLESWRLERDFYWAENLAHVPWERGASAMSRCCRGSPRAAS